MNYEGQIVRLILPENSKGFKSHLYRRIATDVVGHHVVDPASFYMAPIDDVYLMIRITGRTSEARHIIELLDSNGMLTYFDTARGYMELACPEMYHSF